MTARTRTMAACLADAERTLAAPSLLDSIRNLIAAQNALDAHREAHGWTDVDPRGDRYENDAHDHRLHCRAILGSLGIDPDRLSEVLI